MLVRIHKCVGCVCVCACMCVCVCMCVNYNNTQYLFFRSHFPPDINECEDGLDDCDPFADCTNTVGSFECQCQEGFTGDGRECIISQPSLVNECETGVHDCSPFAKCIDLDNGFECRCRPGYVGNGRICRGM